MSAVKPQGVDLSLIQKLRSNSDCLFRAEEVDAAIHCMAEQITAALGGLNPLLLCVMNGGLLLSGRLASLLDFPMQIDYLHATRYRGETTGSDLQWLSYPHEAISGRCVLLVDDILDEGNTLKAVKEYCVAEGASQVYSAVLVEKNHDRRIEGIESDCIGLRIEDEFVFGCGLDYKGYLRNAPGIFAVSQKDLP